MSALLHPYQVNVVDRVDRLLGMAARPLIVAPTGSGKTIIAAEIINRVTQRGGRVLPARIYPIDESSGPKYTCASPASRAGNTCAPR